MAHPTFCVVKKSKKPTPGDDDVVLTPTIAEVLPGVINGMVRSSSTLRAIVRCPT